MSAPSQTRRRGSTVIEFCLSCVLWTTILMGLSTVGLNLIRALQVEQIGRRLGTRDFQSLKRSGGYERRVIASRVAQLEDRFDGGP